jgi:hypothetical protein
LYFNGQCCSISSVKGRALNIALTSTMYKHFSYSCISFALATLTDPSGESTILKSSCQVTTKIPWKAYARIVICAIVDVIYNDSPAFHISIVRWGDYDYKGRPCCQGIMAWELSLEPQVHRGNALTMGPFP